MADPKDSFAYDFGQFLHDRLNAADKEFLLNDPDYKKLRGTVVELKQLIMSQLPESQQKLIVLLSEFTNCKSSYSQEHALMAGFRTALDILKIVNNPRLVIFPSWSKPVEEICEEALTEARALINGEEEE